MIVDKFLRSTSLVPLDDAPMTTSAKFFDLEQFGGVNQSDVDGVSLPIERFATLIVTVAFNEATSMSFQLVSDDAITFNSGAGAVPNIQMAGTDLILKATLIVGYVIFNVSVGGKVLDRYLSFDNTKSGSAETTGKVELFLGLPPITSLNIQKFTT